MAYQLTNHTMTSRALVIMFFVFAGMIPTNATYAEDAASTTNRGHRIEERQDMMKERLIEQRGLFKQKVEERREELSTRFDELKKTRIAAALDSMKERFNFAIERLENIADRVEARIAEIDKTTDADLAVPREHLANARAHIAEALRLVSNITTDVETIVGDETGANGRFTELRGQFRAVKTEIKAAHQELVQAITSIKGIRLGDTATETR